VLGGNRCSATRWGGRFGSFVFIWLTRAFTEARRKSNKSSQGSIANSHSPATCRNATSHQANSTPKLHANYNRHGNRHGDRRFCRRSPMAASMRLQSLGQEMFCEASFCFPNDDVGSSALTVQAASPDRWTHISDSRPQPLALLRGPLVPTSPEITLPIPADGCPYPARAERPPAATVTMPVISMDMPMMLVSAVAIGESGRHKNQRASYSHDERNSV
jgi:hypothetical protein